MIILASGDWVPMAVPTDEQKRRRAGVEKRVERDRVMRFLREASCGLKAWTDRAKLTSQAQCIICVVSDCSCVRTASESPRSDFDRSDEMGRTFFELEISLRFRASSADSRRSVAVWFGGVVRSRQYSLET